MRNVVELADDPLARRLATDLTTDNVHSAVASFFSNPTAAQGTYGPIASWHTAAVTSFEYLFCGYSNADCGTAYDLGSVIERANLTVGVLLTTLLLPTPLFSVRIHPQCHLVQRGHWQLGHVVGDHHEWE